MPETTEKKTETRIAVKMTAEELARAQLLAAELHTTVSALVRDLLRDKFDRWFDPEEVEAREKHARLQQRATEQAARRHAERMAKGAST